MASKNIIYKAEHKLDSTFVSSCTIRFFLVFTNVVNSSDDDDDVYLDKLQTRGVKKSILYMCNVDYSQ
jgi:hypothetical protein